MAANKVLLVDDDPSIIEVLKLYFEKEEYQVVTCMQGDKAFAVFNTSKPDIIILDLFFPRKTAYEICREIRKTSDVPIIMLTARTDTLDKIIGLELGADDYIPKPFEPKEVLARVKAVLRRTERRDNPQTAPAEEEKSTDIITYPGFSVDKIRYVVTVDGNEIYMPPKELELLFFLASNPNRVFTREQLLENVWGYDFYGESRTVDVHIKRIREKIENPDREQNWCIKTVWSKGYKFETR
jgi:DNA-binding response OmpR family regulator